MALFAASRRVAVVLRQGVSMILQGAALYFTRTVTRVITWSPVQLTKTVAVTW